MYRWYKKFYCYNEVINYINVYHKNWVLYVLGQSGEDVTFLVLVDKGASLEAVNAFGDGLAAFQVSGSIFYFSIEE